jgi:TM2 domain-containing membrane protein YozV
MSENESNQEPESPTPEASSPPPGPGPTDAKPPGADKKVLCGVLGIVLGALGVHKFILGYNTEGIIMASVSVVCAVLGSFLCLPIVGYVAMAVIGLIEGIIYLTKSDEEFVATYIDGKKTWF